MRRFYVEEKALVGTETVIRGSEARHIYKVLRLCCGDNIVVFDGTGFDYRAEIKAISQGEVVVYVMERCSAGTESQARISVAQALLKGKKMDVLIRQMTELGAAKWVPFTAERSVPQPKKNRMDDRLARWRIIVKEALKQSRRSEFTLVNPVVSFEEMLQMGASGDVRLIFWENSSEPLERLVQTYSKESRDIWIVLGPEGGFSEKEIDAARSFGFAAVGLGSKILRAETASLAACVLLQYIFGDLGRA